MPSIYRNGIKYSGAGGTYTAGEGIDITNNEISVDTDDIQEKLVSGTNIKTVNNNSLLGSGNISISSGSKNVWYGTSDTAAATVDKVVTTSSGDFTLTIGNIVYVKMPKANTVANPTLNVDGTGTKDILRIDYDDTHAPTAFWQPGEVIGFVYDGTNFVVLDGGIATTAVYGVTKLSSSTSSTSTDLAATPSAVKAAYDLANGKQDALVSNVNIKTVDNTSLLGSGNISTKDIFYGVCDTAAATVAKTVSISGITELTTGLTISVKFENSNTATNPTLQVNSLAAVAIKRYGTTSAGTSAATSWNAGQIVTLTYDGANWEMHDSLNSTYSAMGVTEGQTGTATTARTLSATVLKDVIEYHSSKITTATASLTSTGWTNNAKTVSVTGVTASNSVLVTPALDSMDNYANCGIKCTAQAAGTLTFSCTTVPSSTITVNVMIID